MTITRLTIRTDRFNIRWGTLILDIVNYTKYFTFLYYTEKYWWLVTLFIKIREKDFIKLYSKIFLWIHPLLAPVYCVLHLTRTVTNYYWWKWFYISHVLRFLNCNLVKLHLHHKESDMTCIQKFKIYLIQLQYCIKWKQFCKQFCSALKAHICKMALHVLHQQLSRQWHVNFGINSRVFYSYLLFLLLSAASTLSISPPLLRCKHKTRITEERRAGNVYTDIPVLRTCALRFLFFFKDGTQGMRNTLDNTRHAFQRLRLHSRIGRAIIFSRTSTLYRCATRLSTAVARPS